MHIVTTPPTELHREDIATLGAYTGSIAGKSRADLFGILNSLRAANRMPPIEFHGVSAAVMATMITKLERTPASVAALKDCVSAFVARGLVV